MRNYLEFEKEIKSLEDNLESSKNPFDKDGISEVDTGKIKKIQEEINEKLEGIYSNLNSWQKTMVARHEDRPRAKFYISKIVSDFTQLSGDRLFGEDKSVIAGLGFIENKSVLILAQEKGEDLNSRLDRNFGMMKPEGYRKCIRLMKLADRFGIPVISFIDTPGAYPGIGAEQRGQSQAIADNLFNMSLIKVPMISIIIGEGASGGALAIGLTDKILCLENSWYSVISPEGCASILFGDTAKNKEAADSLQLTSEDLFNLNIADRIIPEPLGGAHHNPSEVYKNVKEFLLKEINYLRNLSIKDLIENRMNKYNNIGTYIDG